MDGYRVNQALTKRRDETGPASELPSLSMKILMGSLVVLFFALFFFGRVPAATPNSSEPVVTKFVAPPYPRAAKDKRIMGTTVSEISVGLDGSVRDVRTVRAHPVFANSVRDALKQWRFRPENQEYKLEVTVSFEFDDACEGTDMHPVTAESRVSAEFPNLVHIVTGLQCVEVSDSDKKQ
jgi:TonB family protein